MPTVQSLKGPCRRPDPFRHKYRSIIESVIGRIVKDRLASTAETIVRLTEGRVPDEDIDRFIALVDDELQRLHEATLARYRLRVPEFIEWKQMQF